MSHIVEHLSTSVPGSDTVAQDQQVTDLFTAIAQHRTTEHAKSVKNPAKSTGGNVEDSVAYGPTINPSVVSPYATLNHELLHETIIAALTWNSRASSTEFPEKGCTQAYAECQGEQGSVLPHLQKS